MIRDPSDGTVRHHLEPLKTKALCEENPVLGTATSGLPKQKREDLERLNASREWIKNWHRKSET